MNRSIAFEEWGLIDYNKAWERQESIFNAAIAQKQSGLPTQNVCIFCEHPHVYTLGKNGSQNNLLINSLQLKSIDAFFVQSNRGGDITYHGPGQIVVYPVFDLANFDTGLKQYVFLLEEIIILALQTFDIQAERLKGAAGVWIDVENPQRCRKIAAIGVRSSRFVTMHGFALNVNTNLNYYSYINPCGFTDKSVTSMAKELGHAISPDDVKKELKNGFERLFIPAPANLPHKGLSS